MTKKESVVLYVKDKIERGLWKEGTRIRSESSLAEDLKVSVVTVRGAYTQLEKENIIERIQGSGTYIKQNSLNKKYILIIIEESIYSEKKMYWFKYLSEEVYNFFKKRGYTPLYIMKNTLELIKSFDLKNVAAIVNILQTSFQIMEKAVEMNIPIIEFGLKRFKYATVTHNTIAQFKCVLKLIEDFKLKNVLIFNKENDCYLNGDLIDKYYSYYFKEKYTCYTKNDNDKDKTPEEFKKLFDSIKKTPDGIVFIDREPLNFLLKHQSSYGKFLKKPKIICFSDGLFEYRKDFNCIYLEMDYKKTAEALCNLTLENMKKEYNTVKTIVIEPEIKYH
ncbi:MAG: winged helix-turn-helix transcriptional regulator [Abditibacteriota bacterium]|nr:winged helix-turn-helix transcriptional regulator [Abditibacteriota bacterium]